MWPGFNIARWIDMNAKWVIHVWKVQCLRDYYNLNLSETNQIIYADPISDCNFDQNITLMFHNIIYSTYNFVVSGDKYNLIPCFIIDKFKINIVIVLLIYKLLDSITRWKLNEYNAFIKYVHWWPKYTSWYTAHITYFMKRFP